MSGKAGGVVGKDVVGKFRSISVVMIMDRIFGHLRAGEAVTFVTLQVTKMGEW